MEASRPHRRVRIALSALLLCLLPSLAHADALRVSDDGRTAGYLTLEWSELQGDRFELQAHFNGRWQLAYQGPDTASTFTGLDDGMYRFRIRALTATTAGAGDAPWSEPLEVQVRHHELGRALGFFGGGALMFGFLLAALAWPVDGPDARR